MADKDSKLYALGCRIAKEAVSAYMNQEFLNDMFAVLCYIRLMKYAEEAGVNDVFDMEALKAKLIKQVERSIARNVSEWETSYVCKPSQFIDSRESIFYKNNEEICDFECDFIMKTQLDNGSWNIPWNWVAYPEEWAISKNWWKSYVIISNLLYLKGFKKLNC